MMLLNKSFNFSLLGMAAGCALGIAADRIYLVLPTNPQPSLSPQATIVLPLQPQAPAEARTVSWYVAHPSEANAKVSVCNDDPGNAQSDPECLNAATATEKIGINQLLSGMKQ